MYYPIRGQNYFYGRAKTEDGNHLWHIYWAVLIASSLTHLPFDGTFEMVTKLYVECFTVTSV
jgi:hypothetical protein